MDPNPLAPYLPLAVALLLSGLLALVIVLVTSVTGPKRSSATKMAAWEAGSESVGSARQRFAIKFYVVGLLFIIFDVEMVFMYPWAVNYLGLGWYGYWVMAVFALPIVVGLAYEWKKGALEWEH
jgi:NADH-quinone oxidoreductase subunit A